MHFKGYLSVSKLINQSVRLGPLGFAGNDQEVEPGEVTQVAVVRGRRREVKTSKGPKRVTARARMVIAPGGLAAISGGEGAPVSVDDLGRVLGAESIIQVTRALGRDRKRRKKNLQGKGI